MIITILATAWVLACAVIDYRKQIVPNKLVGVGFTGAMILFTRNVIMGKIGWFHVLVIAFTWSIGLYWWGRGSWGAGDAKFTMTLIVAFPDHSLLLYIFYCRLIYSIALMLVDRAVDIEVLYIRLPAIPILAVGYATWMAHSFF